MLKVLIACVALILLLPMWLMWIGMDLLESGKYTRERSKTDAQDMKAQFLMILKDIFVGDL